MGGVEPICSIKCALELAKRKREKKEAKDRAESKRETRVRKEAILTLRQREAKARKAAQEYARLRDIKWFIDRGEQPKCIMCGTENPSSWQGAHFIAVGSKGGPRSFHPANINLSCLQCNLFKAQEQTEYQANMVRKYGAAMVEYLKTAPLDYTMTAEDIEDVRAHYRQLIKELKR